jgi:hypothetical protein
MYLEDGSGDMEVTVMEKNNQKMAGIVFKYYVNTIYGNQVTCILGRRKSGLAFAPPLYP